MKTSTLDRLIWTLIYGGLIGLALGLSIRSGDPLLGWGFVGAGVLTSLAGAGLVWVRSRRAGP